MTRFAFGSALALITGMTACAALKNTPAQDLAWQRWEQCKQYPSIMLQEIRPDGGVVVMYTNGGSEREAWQECMRKAAREQAAQRKR